MDSMWEIRKYDAGHKDAWNEFVEVSRNATFLFRRDYMDYHSDRFEDCSLMAYRSGKLAAVLPANRVDNTLYSHQGLTYGGWALAPEGLDTSDIFNLWKTWLSYCAEEGLATVVYKPLPYIYAEMPSQEDLYMLFLAGATLKRVDISTAIDLDSNPGFNTLQKRHLKKLPSDFYCEVVSGSDAGETEEFHRILVDCLQQRHSALPVHSLEELRLLMERFPEDILIWCGYTEGRLNAAVCVYETGMCVHCQYIATTIEGRERNVLSGVFNEMIEFYSEEGVRYFDFGISNEGEGRYLNSGLNRQKTSYGGSGVAYQQYEINVSSALKSMPTSLWPPQ